MSRRLLVHIIVAVLAWALFGYYWGLVAQRRITDNTTHGIRVLLVLVLIIWALTTAWIQHNRRRFAGRPDRRARRTASGSAAAVTGTDAIDYAIEVRGSGPPLQVADYVEVEIDENHRVKTFRIARIPAGDGSP